MVSFPDRVQHMIDVLFTLVEVILSLTALVAHVDKVKNISLKRFSRVRDIQMVPIEVMKVRLEFSRSMSRASLLYTPSNTLQNPI